MVGWEYIPHPPPSPYLGEYLLAIASMLVDGLCKPSYIEVPSHKGFSVSLAISCMEVAAGNST